MYVIWQGGGGMKILKLEAWNFSSPPSLAVHFLGAPPPVGFEVYKFWEPPVHFFRAPLSGV